MIGAALLRRRFPGLGARAAQAFMDKLHGTVSKEITPGGLPELGQQYKQFINQLGRDNPSQVPTFSDFLAAKGVKAPETMKLIEQAQSAGPSTPSQIVEGLVKRDEGAQQRTLDAYLANSTPTADGSARMRLRPGFWKQDPNDFAEQFSGLPSDQQAALQSAVRSALGQMPYRQFARRFLGTDPAYAQDRAILQATLPQDARTAFIKQLQAEQMMHKGALDYTAPGSIPGGGTLVDPIEAGLALHDAVTGGFSVPGLALRLLRGPADPPARGLRIGNEMLFNPPDATITPGLGAEPGSYNVPRLDSYSPKPWWVPDKLDTGIGAGVGAIDYGLEGQDEEPGP